MSDTLQSENRQLREQLAALIDEARRNEEIMRRHQDFDLSFISAAGFRELIESIFAALSTLSKLDVVTLTMLDPKYEIRRILQDLNISLTEFPNLLFLQNTKELGALKHMKLPSVGPFEATWHNRLFPAAFTQPSSIAIVPLWRQSGLTGVLSLGSLDSKRFTTDMATDFLEHMALIIAICLENVINIERLKHLGLMDPLTGVNNRRYVDQRLIEEVVRTKRRAGDFCCLYIDIDHFKHINDNYGHLHGDDVLREVATRIKAELRLSDTLGRFGGEEFVVLLPDTQLNHACMVAERIRAGIGNRPFTLNPESLHVSISIGVARMDTLTPDQTFEMLGQKMLTQADEALYQAKENGRNRVQVADQT
jgi:two-component system cell cycle response regulator